MTIHLIHGRFTPQEAIDIITKMVHVKIKFHEDKITASSNEEDVKMREKRIKQLQKELYELRVLINTKKQAVTIEGPVEIN